MTLLAASLAGAVGAVCRYWLSGWAQQRAVSGFPFGTMVVNLTGALALGLVVGGAETGSALTIALAGFCGGFTTFSTWMVETLGLGPMSRQALANLLLSLGGGLLAALVGYTLVG